MERGYWPAAHHEIFCDVVERVARGEEKNVIVMAWPGSAKSTYFSQLAVAWIMAQPCWTGMPWDILQTCHNSELAEEFSFRVRNHIRDDPHLLGYDLETEGLQTWRTDKGDAYRAFGIMAGITGRRFDLGNGDDWVKNAEKADSPTEMGKLWRAYNSDFRSRAKPDAAVIIPMTSWAELDPVGQILPDSWDGESGYIEGKDGLRWYVVCLSAICDEPEKDILGRQKGESGWPEWQPRAWMEQQRNALVSAGLARTWSTCWQQKRAPEEGSYFKRAWFRYYETLPPGCRFFVTSDFAVSEDQRADNIAHHLWAVDAENRIYLVHEWCERATLDNDGTDAALDMVAMGMRDRNFGCWLNETGVIRKSLGSTIRSKMKLRNIHCQTEDYTRHSDKQAMASGIKNKYASGMVYHPLNGPFVPAYEAELLKFGGGSSKDDRVDSAALLGLHMDKVIAPPKTSLRPVMSAQWGLGR